MNRVRTLGFLIITIIIAACAPAVGRPAVPYLAAPQEVISAVAQFGPFMDPPSLYNHFSIETIGDGFITLRADMVSGAVFMSALGGGQNEPIRVTITTFEQSEVTNVAIGIIPANHGDFYEIIIKELDRRFKRAPAQH